LKIGITSDLHLEFRNKKYAEEVLEVINNTPVDILLIAGDVHSDEIQYDKFLKGNQGSLSEFAWETMTSSSNQCLMIL
jgi:predicted phosphodiesterase